MPFGGCYEWEGMPDCPEEEAIFADKYQLEHPDGPFRELLPLVCRAPVVMRGGIFDVRLRPGRACDEGDTRQTSRSL